jgi:hypothetical protein
MLEIEAIQGSAAHWVLTAINRDGTTPTGFLATDTLSASLWSGQSQTPLFAPAVSWNNFATGAVNLGVTNAQTTGLDQAGTYHLQVSAARAGSTVVIIDCLLKVLPAPGSSSNAIVPYNTYPDMLTHAPWITMIQDVDADQEAFYTQRLEAKQWLDWLIVRSWRGTSSAYFGDPGSGAQYWLGGWARRSPQPSQWLINQLAGGVVINGSLKVTTAGSGYSFANVTFSGGGPNATQATASAIVSGGQVIAIQLITAGTGYSSTPTVTITGDGTGASATCQVSANVLILRPQIRRVCALKAASIVGLGQIGRMNNVAVFGALWRDMASSESHSIVAELDLNGDGISDLAIPLGTTNTLFT